MARAPYAPSRRRAFLTVAIPLLVMVAVEVLSIKANIEVIVLIVVSALTALVLAARFSILTLALWALGAATLTFTWNGVFIGSQRPADLLAPLALLLLAASYEGGRLPRLPIWISQLAIVLLLLVFIHLTFPATAHYLNSRTVLTATGQQTVSTKGSLTSAELGVAIKFIIAVAIIPLAYMWSAIRQPATVRIFAGLFAFGAGFSGTIAFIERLGLSTPIERILLHGKIRPGLSRQIGLAFQPNYLAAGLVIALPIAMWLLTESGKWSRWVGWYSVGACLLGVYASGSRGGAACVVLAALLGFLLIAPLRGWLPIATVVSATGVVGVLAAEPSIALSVLRSLRIVGGGAATSGSNEVRSLLYHQAITDIQHSPLYGIGLQVIAEAQNVYLQELASGGLILFTAMLIYALSGVIKAYRLAPQAPLAGAICASILSSLALNIFEADLTDRFYYIPAALLVSLGITLELHPETGLGTVTAHPPAAVTASG
jgi:O-antigen ligase